MTLAAISSYGFNHLLVSFYANHSDWNGALGTRVPGHIWWAADPRNTPWRGMLSSDLSTEASTSGSMLDYSQLNFRYLSNWDRVLSAAYRFGPQTPLRVVLPLPKDASPQLNRRLHAKWI